MTGRISFLGAAGTVTGSRFLLETAGRRYLVDCGLFQGGRAEKALNWEPLPLAPERIDAILLTHAHIDHVGYLPRLVQQGFRSPVYATDATCALLKIVLPDAAHLQEQDAKYANKKGYSRHRPALPLYGAAEAEAALELTQAVPFRDPQSLDGITVTWLPAGHILGSAILQIEAGELERQRRIVFSGDLGRYHSEVMRPPTAVGAADVVVMESTYGGRLHSTEPVGAVLSSALKYISETKGVLLIPAFAVGRTQEVLYHIRKLQEQGLFGSLPVFIDSPMATEISHIYCRFGDDHNLDKNLLMDRSECPLRCRDTRFVRDVEESKLLNRRTGPAVVISASGMCTGGRIVHHLKWRLPDKRNAVLFIGYQAEGTRGRLLLNGAPRITIHGETLPVRARIFQAHSLSAHADGGELLRWLGGFSKPPSQALIVHGESSGSLALQRQIQHQLAWKTSIPKLGEVRAVP